MKANTVKHAAAVAGCASGLFLALVGVAAPAGADPVDPVPPPPAPVTVLPAPAPAPDSEITVQAAGPDAPPVPPNGVPHLASPDALPPGSTMDPSVVAGESPNVSYLRDLWHAVQNQEISGKEALLLGVAQRGMNTPIPAQAPGPNVPLRPVDPVAAPAPAPAPPLSPFPPTP
ncbi:hypothetical protein TUM20985_25730 [Mycobacterium antarcticum]|uniref:hypothetical protein n=1 Tax=unclassified Mycolicibacterium TaxID=2636767 RepID=UPI0023981C84|nr:MULTISPECIES: hypothetical protein [unclassified Mycolicibacterium]BDX32026.1 hypothetical protein TUM20985_25730 [Mycolicibacterium sp. TUM20985]GLP75330.1 hypothetical protein TUM20983_24400 [Mycolicibacterium sp. TUM20983]GLP84406.1 hypothetical protein TUM20984_58260 [Mycolicibacterium sp. TUM20984]